MGKLSQQTVAMHDTGTQCQRSIFNCGRPLARRHAAFVRGKALRVEQSQQEEAKSESFSQEALSNGLNRAHSNSSQPVDAQGYVSVQSALCRAIGLSCASSLAFWSNCLVHVSG